MPRIAQECTGIHRNTQEYRNTCVTVYSRVFLCIPRGQPRSEPLTPSPARSPPSIRSAQALACPLIENEQWGMFAHLDEAEVRRMPRPRQGHVPRLQQVHAHCTVAVTAQVVPHLRAERQADVGQLELSQRRCSAHVDPLAMRGLSSFSCSKAPSFSCSKAQVGGTRARDSDAADVGCRGRPPTRLPAPVATTAQQTHGKCAC